MSFIRLGAWDMRCSGSEAGLSVSADTKAQRYREHPDY